MSTASHVRLRRLIGAALLLILVLGLLRTGLAAGATKQPPTPSDLPVAIEGLARHTPQTSCDPTTKPGTLKLARLLTRTYRTTRYGTVRACGPTPNSEHQDGRAVDWMVSVRSPAPRPGRGRARLAAGHGRDQNAYAMARRLGVMYLIWNNRIWSASRADDGWRPYSDCAEPPRDARPTAAATATTSTSPSPGRARAASPPTGPDRVAKADFGPCRPADLSWAAPYARFNPAPCTRYPPVTAPAGASSTLRTLVTYSGRTLREGTTGVAVKAVQTVVGVSTTGTFGSGTERALLRWQAAHGLSRTGVVGPATWRALLRSQAP